MYSRIAFVLSFLFISFLSVDITSAAEIREIVDIVKDSKNIQWSNQEGSELKIDVLGADSSQVSINNRASEQFNKNGARFYLEHMPRKTIEIKTAPTLGKQSTNIRGKYYVTLPDMKRVQLEVMYDLIAPTETMHGAIDFYIELETEMKGSNVWVKASEFGKEDSFEKIQAEPIIRLQEETFSTHSFMANLSEWRGQKVCINLIAETPRTVVSPQMGRWLEARLVGSSFDIALDTPVELYPFTSSNKNTSKTSIRASQSVKTSSLVMVPGTKETFSFSGLADSPEGGGVIELKFRDFSNNIDVYRGYFAGTRTIDGGSGTSIIDFNFYENFQSPVTTIQNRLLRDAYNQPQVILPPLAQPSENLDTGYMALCGAIISEPLTSGRKVHGVAACEDKRENTSPYNLYRDLYTYGDGYGRISYVRSTDGYNFTRMSNQCGINPVSSMTPILTHWQQEEVTYAPPDIINQQLGTSRNYWYPNDTVPLIQYPAGMKGLTTPCIIEKGDYYYVFYTRYFDTRQQTYYKNLNGYPGFGYPPFLSVIELSESNPDMSDYVKGNMCVARALISDVKKSNTEYYNSANPWKKYYRYRQNLGGGQWGSWVDSWNQPGISTGTTPDTRTGLDTGLLPTPCTFGKVSWNTYLNCYVFITMSPDGYHFYLHVSNGDNLVSWQDGMLIGNIYETGKGYAYPCLLAGDDRTSARTNFIYYAEDPTPPAGGGFDGGHVLARRGLEFIQ